ncbi:type IV secretion system protein [Stenotrophomonas sp. PS02289]|uniref:type IV secretion system protein n=1 Tax=Stenotrophomonas sp. PS02289 TaxID=2991422 RepID=UPI00249AE4A5|nr:type IV secretion system protein [Stenotrophomonas sp. PS02289]
MNRLIASFGDSGGLQDLLGYVVRVQEVGDLIFFRLILNYLRQEIADFGFDMMKNMMYWVGGMALTLMTLWVLIQGYRIITGQSRDSMMALVTNMARAALIVSVATSMSMFGTSLHTLLTKDLKEVITARVTDDDESPEEQIDKSLALMQVALASVDYIKTVDDEGLRTEKAQSMWFIGLGTGGPAVTAGAMLMLYEVAIALFIGFGPLFILCLLFDQTKQLFQKWLLYGIGTLFSMAVLAAMVNIALGMVIRVAGAFWVADGIGRLLPDGVMSDGITSMAMQQGGMGLILTTLILTAPPMAQFFFQGTLGSFMAYSQIGGGASGQPGPQGQPPGSYTPPQTTNQSVSERPAVNMDPQATMARTVSQSTSAPSDASGQGRMGNHPTR